jgi:DnaD/phage-associated family protein
MPPFPGFPNGKVHLIPLPAPFFEDLMLQIDNREELLITLQAFYLLDQLDGTFRFLRQQDFSADARFMQALGEKASEAKKRLKQGLEKAVDRGTLIATPVQMDDKKETCYFLNSPKGRAAVRAITSGQWSPGENINSTNEMAEELPNIFRLYEENIGPITPLLAEMLSEAEDTYPAHWIEDALRIAVERNKRNWRYAEAILKKWQVEGRDAKKEQSQDRRDSAENRRRYVEGEFSDFIEH